MSRVGQRAASEVRHKFTPKSPTYKNSNCMTTRSSGWGHRPRVNSYNSILKEQHPWDDLQCIASCTAHSQTSIGCQQGKPSTLYLQERGAGTAASVMLAARTAHMSATWHREVNRFSALFAWDADMAVCLRAVERAVSSKLRGSGKGNGYQG